MLVAGMVKGWAFVAVTSALLLYLLRRQGWTAGRLSSGWARRRVVVFVVLTFGIAGLVGLAIVSSLREERERAYNQLLAVSQSKARELADWHEERMRNAQWVSKARFLRQQWDNWRFHGQPLGEGRALMQFLQDFSFHAPYARVELLDGQARIQISTADAGWIAPRPDAGVPADPVLKSGVQEVLLTGHSLRVGPWRDTQGEMRLAILCPVMGNYPMVVALHLDPPESLLPTLGDWPIPQKTAESFLFRQEGDHLLYLSALRYEANAAGRKVFPLTSDVLGAQVLLGKSRSGQLLEGLDYRGVPVLAVAQPVGQTGWWLLSKQDRSELMQNALQRGSWMVLAGLLGLLSLGSAIYFYDERQQRLRSQSDLDALRRVEHSLSESEALYRLLADNSHDLVWLIDVPGNRFIYVSPSVERVLGYQVAEMMALSPSQILGPDDLAGALDRYRMRVHSYTAGDLQARTANFEVNYRHKDGHLVTFEADSTLVADEQGQMSRLQTVSRDITQRKKDQSEVLRLSQALEQSPASVIITDLHSRIEYVNHAFEQTSGYSRAQAVGRSPAFLRSSKTTTETYAAMWQTLVSGQAWHGELVNRHRDGREYVQSMTIAPIRDAGGTIRQYLAVQLDVTAQKDAELQAYRLAWFNPLTGLPNRHRLQQALRDELQASSQTGEVCALLVLNLDRFQNINDVLGHTAGDALLLQVGQRLGSILNAPDLLVHANADEFAVLVRTRHGSPAPASTEALRLAARLHGVFDQPFTLPEHSQALNISCCVGVALLPQGGKDTPGEVMRRADTALHRAKEVGPRQTALFDEAMEQILSRRFLIERDLRRGLAAQELRLFLQTQVNAQGDVVGAEALVRWQHPEQGLMSPVAFIPIAEQSDLITEVGRWVLDAVCHEMGQLHDRGLRLPMAVNISPRQFHQPDFVATVLDLLKKHRAVADDLIIEITESIFMDRLDSVVQKMSQLTSQGVKFSIDDFGTGYSSLAYLKRLPIHEIKIDRSFVQDAPSDPNDAALVEAILSVARHLRLKVVAEGVETTEQAEFLIARGHVILQGFLYSRPGPAHEVLDRWMDKPAI